MIEPIEVWRLDSTVNAEEPIQNRVAKASTKPEPMHLYERKKGRWRLASRTTESESKDGRKKMRVAIN